MSFDQTEFQPGAVVRVVLKDAVITVHFGPAVDNNPSSERWIQHVLKSSRREQKIRSEPQDKMKKSPEPPSR